MLRAVTTVVAAALCAAPWLLCAVGGRDTVAVRPVLATDPLAVLRSRTVGPLLPSVSSIHADVAAASEAAGSVLANGSWADIDYADISKGGHDHWGPALHLARLRSMVVPLVGCQLEPSANPLCNSTELRGKAEAALAFWLARNPCSQNWWFNQINSPSVLAETLLLLQHGGMLATSTLELADVDVRRGADWWRGWSGYNLVSLASLQIYRGLLFNSSGYVQEGFDAVWSQLAVMPWPPPEPSKTGSARCNSSSAATVPCIDHSCEIGGGSYLGDGIQADGSFHQHGAQLLDGAYGAGLTSAILGFLPIAVDLPWQPSAAHLDAFALHVLGGQFRMTLPQPAVWDWQVCGRGCLCGGTAHNTLHPSLLRSTAASYYAPGSAAALGFQAFADVLEGKPANASTPGSLGTVGFWRSDYLVHRRPGWSASWKGRSNRTIAARCVNSDSKMSADTGEGATFVYRADAAATAFERVWPVINWQQFPGITCRQAGLAACTWQYEYDAYPTFVGSVADGDVGAAAQAIANHGVSARRSWLFFDAGVASLVTNLTSAGPLAAAPVLTTLANQRLAGDVLVRFRNGSTWAATTGNHTFGASSVAAVHHNHTAYAIDAAVTGAGTFTVESGLRTGDLVRISSVERPVNQTVFRVSFQHDPPASGATDRLAPLGFTILPNVDADALGAVTPPAMAGSGPAHVLADCAAEVAALLFWAPGTANLGLCSASKASSITVTASAPCLVIVRRANGGVSVSASNPDTPGLQLKLTLGGVDAAAVSGGPGCSLLAKGPPTELQVSLGRGASVGQPVTCLLSVP